MEVESSFETKVTLSPEDLTLLANYTNKSEKAKRVDGYGSIDQLIEKKIKEQYEGKCSRSGYVLPNSIKLLSRSVGMVEKGRFTGELLFYAEARCKVYQPPEGVLLAGIVTHKNRMGIYVDYNNHAIRIMVPRDLHIGNEEFDAIEPGDLVKVEIKKSRYQVNDTSILSVGVFKGKAKKAGYYGFEDKDEPEAVAALGLAKQEREPTPEPVKERDVEDVLEQPLEAPINKVPKPNAGSTDYYFYSTLPEGKELDPLYPVSITLSVDKEKPVTYKSVEHFMQEKKFGPKQSAIIGAIRAADTPLDARKVGTQKELQVGETMIQIGPKHLRKDWDLVKDDLMKKVQTAKFTANPELRDKLLATGDRKLIYADPYDSYWGIGKDKLGQNKLGQSLMELRTTLREAPATAPVAATAAPAKRSAKKATVVVAATIPEEKPKPVVSAPATKATKAKKSVAPPPPPPPPVLLSDSDAESSEED